jgi:AhpD family alkylhydroperoxidase
LRRTWESLKEVMAPGALDPLTKELIYIAVSVTNSCAYCMASHGAAARRLGMTKEMFAELVAVIGMAKRDQPPRRRLSGAGGRAVRKPVLIKAHRAGAFPEAIGAPMIAI